MKVWMDEDTGRSLRWYDIWSRFQPRTPMGQRAKESLSPFYAGGGEGVAAVAGGTGRVTGSPEFPGGLGRRVEELLKRLPDPSAVLRMLERRETPKVSDWFRLKQFLWQGRLLREWIPEAAPDSRFRTRKEEWREGIALMDPGSVPSAAFALTPALDPRLGPLKPAATRKSDGRKKPGNEWQRLWRKTIRCGETGRGNGWWTVTPPSWKDTGDPRVLRVRETPFEVICRPSPTREETEAIRRLNLAKEELEAVERESSDPPSPLSNRNFPSLRRPWRRWPTLTCYWARMQAAEGWDGTRPLPGESYRIRGGVHPLALDPWRSRGEVSPR